MKIVSLSVDNFRAIRHIKIENIGAMVVIAGPNGCGKSSVLDAIRLLKSAYGAYEPLEYQRWFEEFQIDIGQNPENMTSLLRDDSRPAVIRANIALSHTEIEFIEEHLLEDAVPPHTHEHRPGSHRRTIPAGKNRVNPGETSPHMEELLRKVQSHLKSPVQEAHLEISTSGQLTTHDNPVLKLVFSSLYPQQIGVIAYHGPHRNYEREVLEDIQLSEDDERDKTRAFSLNDAEDKYSDLKKEMANDYVREALRQRARPSEAQDGKELSSSLSELFGHFFPDKTFSGPEPTPDGLLSFPVTLQDGATHDINDLSSGEKEVLFGYLRLRKSAPRHSVVLLDEPELHLHPALVGRLPRFYREKLASDLDNQLWVVTHSDAFLREAMSDLGTRVLHMHHGDESPSGSQVQDIQTGAHVEAVILDLVGDLATYQPGAKIVVLEGSTSNFDQRMVSKLFPNTLRELNFVSGGDRKSVRSLHEIVQGGFNVGEWPISIYSIVDSDSDSYAGRNMNDKHESRRRYKWDVYHIENYLLVPEFIFKALAAMRSSTDGILSLEEIDTELISIARSQIDELASHVVGLEIRRQLERRIPKSIHQDTNDIGSSLYEAVQKYVGRIESLAPEDLSVDAIHKKVETQRTSLEKSLENEEWRSMFKGRKILKRFAGRYAQNMRYEFFRNQVLYFMAEARHEPEGMKRILEEIRSD